MVRSFAKTLRPLALIAILLAAAGSATAQPGETPIPSVKFTRDLRGFETYSIMQIQGRDNFSSIPEETVATTGVVTAVTADGSGYWIQDPKGDGDPATSDGLYVVWGAQPPRPEPPKPGDLVRVIGRIQELHRGVELPRTQMANLIPPEVLSSGNPLPEPVPLRDLPDVEIADALTFWEPLEGMRVSLENARVVGPTNRFGEFAVIAEADAVPGSGYYAKHNALLLRNAGGDRVDYNPERTVIGDKIVGKIAEVRPGDEVGALVGNVDYSFGHYKIQASKIEMKTVQPPPRSPVGTLGGSPGDVRIADMTGGGFFDETDDPETFDENNDPSSGRLHIPSHEDVELRLTKFALAVIDEMRLPDILMMQEFENQALLQRIGDKVNAQKGTRYRAVSFATSDRRGLEAGFLFDEARVELVDAHLLKGKDVEDAFGLTSPFRNREPMVGVFRFSPGGPPVTIFNLKLKSKRQEPPIPNLDPTPDRLTEWQRKLQVRVVRNRVNDILAKDPNALVMVGGDFGDFELVEPGEVEGPVQTIAGKGNEVRLASLMDLAEEGSAYTWIYHGNGQALSHMLVSPALRKRFSHIDVLHFNSPMPNSLGRDPSTALRATDRDVIQAGFDLRPASTRVGKR
jgi:predicted extracellular nuclease